MTFLDMLASGEVFGGLLQTAPVAPLNLASILAMQPKQIGPVEVVLESNNLIPATCRYSTRYPIAVDADLLDVFPWGYALFFKNPAAALLVAVALPAVPSGVMAVGQEYTIRSALTSQEVQY